MDNEALTQLTDISRVGDELERFYREGAFGILKKHILDPMYEEAFIAFTKVEPSDAMGITQTQMMAKVIKTIESRIESKINEGRVAKHRILSLNEEE